MSDVTDKPRDRARRRLLALGVYTPAALVSLATLSESSARAAPTTGTGAVAEVKAQSQSSIKSS